MIGNHAINDEKQQTNSKNYWQTADTENVWQNCHQNTPPDKRHPCMGI